MQEVRKMGVKMGGSLQDKEEVTSFLGSKMLTG